MRVRMPDETDDRLRITLDVPGASPADVVEAFLDPATVRRWWGGARLTVEETVGGPYIAYFDRLDQTMRGAVTSLDRAGGRFGFDWSWDHAPELPARHVDVTVDEGAVLHLVQGAYDSSEVDQDEARSHRDGWEFFLPRLVAQVSARAR